MGWVMLGAGLHDLTGTSISHGLGATDIRRPGKSLTTFVLEAGNQMHRITQEIMMELLPVNWGISEGWKLQKYLNTLAGGDAPSLSGYKIVFPF
ncbi:hypothetical protein TVAGG3_0497670 [Trichomonas vaginalis G3]|uniref:hypothetical protein n=1 Tax=Trichomonas vaginalis (strain ATCC PRA-98 / G3) TaxID=412133 RepID=UPI0021E58A41|nr:hypothetical protein TVAGG3_0497670 [Trichomonas vaginalis G3]KAI5516846.1 hypothetical protein TVAGG3_0497670 [Trichomonas vaginalis G3]